MEKMLFALGQRIQQARKDKGLSQNKLSEILSISTPHLSEIERGCTSFSVTIFSDIAEALGVSADSLLNIDTPYSRAYRCKEIEELISGCTPDEIEIMLGTLKAMKANLIMHRHEE